MSNVVYLRKANAPNANQPASKSETEQKSADEFSRWLKDAVRRAISCAGQLRDCLKTRGAEERIFFVMRIWREAFAAMFQMTGGVKKLKRRIFPWRVEIAALRAEVSRYRQLTDDRFRAASDQCYALERLLTSSPATRPPGAQTAAMIFGDPAVSIVMPTYNRAGVIAEAIMSVQAQSFRAWELAIIDDGSADDTEQIVSRFTSDRRIRYIRQKHGGAARARNRGLEETRAPLIAYLDSDNLWYPQYLAAAVDHFAANPDDDAVYAALVSYIHGLESRCILWKLFDRNELIKSNFIDANVFMHRRTLTTRFGTWDEELKRLSDWDLVLRYTVDRPAQPINVLGAFYRKCDDIRITDCEDIAAAQARIRAKRR